MSSDVEAAVAALSDPTRRMTPHEFLAASSRHDSPGLFAWWGSDQALSIIGRQLQAIVSGPLYAGQAGATRVPDDHRAVETLASRISSRHLTGTPSSSGFRRNVTALLLEPLHLRVDGDGRVCDDDNAMVSQWIGEHLEITTFPVSDRDQLAALETAAVTSLDPPLNVDHMRPSAVRSRLTILRAALARVS